MSGRPNQSNNQSLSKQNQTYDNNNQSINQLFPIKMPYNLSDIFFIAIFIIVIVIRELYAQGVLTVEMLYTIAGENVTMYAFLGILLFLIRKNISPAPTPTPIPATADQKIKKLEQAFLSLQNEINKMRTEVEWRSEARSGGQASITSFSSEYSTEIETLWVEFTALFDERRKREKCSPTKIYNALSIEINLSSATLASFYRHQKIPLKTSLDKIEAWIEKKTEKKITRLSLVVVAVVTIEVRRAISQEIITFRVVAI
ncbi:hypothetical protein Glove_421g116 [Diversispora epigaea]|uniref:Uncharacterized protein n=1 Tax=Diversispora epigaea TaxID=1348612 RepID=A0A397GZW8_9GLOM|nr:hypothetical protein Glove_421g116 [Diversispora epigaea]